MHEIEPFYQWRDDYISAEDERSPFYNTEYSEFYFDKQLYNFLIHPQWDDFGSSTMYIKVLYADYDRQYAIIEFIGEWNDAINNDIMLLKREIIELMIDEGINKFILIGENVLNFHSGDKDYYEEWFEEVTEADGWIVCLNMPEQTQHDFNKRKLQYLIEKMEVENWRIYKPFHLFKHIDQQILKRLE